MDMLDGRFCDDDDDDDDVALGPPGRAGFPGAGDDGDTVVDNNEGLVASSFVTRRNDVSKVGDRLLGPKDGTRSRSWPTGGEDLREVDPEFKDELGPEGARFTGESVRLFIMESFLGERPPRYGLLDRPAGRPYESRSLNVDREGDGPSLGLSRGGDGSRSLLGDLGIYRGGIGCDISLRDSCLEVPTYQPPFAETYFEEEVSVAAVYDFESASENVYLRDDNFRRPDALQTSY
ncbi:hypothetical protein UA08_05816 [Talaromyces atroroseus]|uniref:Uncharacterized protein n=1 Tax=Talaromyces atroroseus TaxID=1441469 RepID=A0A225ADB5_TALAT|nr:hypothetical protein UA08_05816 [Talaromyces atroroseus]OKL59161.1 hypothetical protein UA08_05816 [Talaromyces atroroseus]